MRVIKALFPGGLALLLAACGAASGPAPAGSAAAAGPDDAALREQVLAAERAFAASMARRDFAAFGRLVDEEAIFFGSKTLRGRQAVLDAWSGYFTAQEAPFSWEPDQAEVLDSGTLALTTGPVRDAAGKPVARFNSIWRRNARGEWQVIFDKGSALTPSRETPAQ